jgi:hypothetical protein
VTAAKAYACASSEQLELSRAYPQSSHSAPVSGMSAIGAKRTLGGPGIYDRF